MRIALCLSLSLLIPCTLKAVIVAGANGGSDNANNTTAAQIQSSLGINGAFYDNVISYSNAGAVYLGWTNPGSGNVAYALSEMHITFSNTIVISGVTYSVSEQSISGSDLALLTLTQTSGIMPPLPAIVMASSTPAVGNTIVMAGFGQARVQAATTSANVSDAVAISGNGTGYTTSATAQKRWGTNTFAGTTSGLINGAQTNLGASDFTTPSPGQWLTTNEAQAVVGDSGGGVFNLSGQLVGLMAAVSGTSTEAAFNELTYFSDLPTYKSTIDSITGGALIPEPGTISLFLLGGLGAGFFVFRRRKA